MTVLDSINNTPAQRGIPRQGSTVSQISADEDIAALIAQLTQASPEAAMEAVEDNYDEVEDDAGTPEDLASLVAQLPAGMSGDPTPTDTMLPTDIELPPPMTSSNDDDDDLIDSDDLGSDSDTGTAVESGSPDSFKKKLLAGLVIIAIIIIAAIFANLGNKSGNSEQNTPSQSQSSNTNTFYTDIMTLTDTQTYQDSMIIEKYIILDQDACIFVFRGYAENARAFVTAYVDIDTYNRYRTGARVPILYEHISISGEDYYMKVRVNI